MALTQAEIDKYNEAVSRGLSAEEAGAEFGLSGNEVNQLAIENNLDALPFQGEQVDSQGGILTPEQLAAGQVSSTQVGLDVRAETTDGGITTDPTQVQQITSVPTASGGTAKAGTASTSTIDLEDVQQIEGIDPIAPAQIGEIATAEAMTPTQAAEGAVSEDAIARLEESFTPSEGTTTEAVEIGPDDIMDGSTVVAATSTMQESDIAVAAEVAGVEVARVQQFREQLRRVGLSEAQIDVFGNDPTAMEAELLNYSDAQRGMIGELPVEALVSVQMGQLLAGLESGEIPLWARPAVSAVEQMLARRGMSASTVGRDALANVIIQAAMPLASQNAQTIKEAAFRATDFERTVKLQNAQFAQQAVLQNAQNSFNLNLTNLNNEQQARLANSQFMQTVTLQNASHRQQTALQNSVNLVNLDVAELDSNTRLAVENAKAFLAMDLANLSNAQQAAIVDAQYEQQRLLSNAAAENARLQFNATSQNQVDMFMAEMAANIQQYNATQYNSALQFNSSEANRISALNAQNKTQASLATAQMKTQVSMANAQMEAQVAQWNAANAQLVEQSNIEWRRQANLADTAAQNAINQQNVQNSFNLQQSAQGYLWQEMRDTAMFDFTAEQNDQDRKTQLYASAMNYETGGGAIDQGNMDSIMGIVDSFFGGEV